MYLKEFEGSDFEGRPVRKPIARGSNKEVNKGVWFQPPPTSGFWQKKPMARHGPKRKPTHFLGVVTSQQLFHSPFPGPESIRSSGSALRAGAVRLQGLHAAGGDDGGLVFSPGGFE